MKKSREINKKFKEEIRMYFESQEYEESRLKSFVESLEADIKNILTEKHATLLELYRAALVLYTKKQMNKPTH